MPPGCSGLCLNVEFLCPSPNPSNLFPNPLNQPRKNLRRNRGSFCICPVPMHGQVTEIEEQAGYSPALLHNHDEGRRRCNFGIHRIDGSYGKGVTANGRCRSAGRAGAGA